jgi:CHAT domain-containing protein/Tfp pilus assembly protein PilF
MKARVLGLALVLVAVIASAAQPADSLIGTIDSLRKAKTKEERAAALKGKTDEFLYDLLMAIFNAQTQMVERGEFAELERTQEWAEEITAQFKDEDQRGLCELLCRLGRGRNEQAREHYQEAAETFKKLLVDVRKKGLKPFEPALLNNLGAVQYHLGDFVGGLETLEEARRSLAGMQPAARQMMEGMILGNLGELYTEVGDYPRAEKLLEESIEMARARRDAGSERTARLNLANIDLHRCRYREAIKAYQDLLADCRKARAKTFEGKILNNIGLALEESGRTGEALQQLEEARKLAAELRHRRSEAMALGNIALVHLRLDEDEEAIRYNNLALKLFEAVGDKAGVARCLKLKGMSRLDARKPEEAEKAFLEALAILEAGGSKAAVAEMQSAIGMVYFQTRDWKKAQSFFERSLKTYQDLHDSRRLLLAHQMVLMTMAATDDPRYDAQFLAFKLDAIKFDDRYATVHADYFEAMGNLLQKNWVAAETCADRALRILESRVALSMDPQIRAGKLNSSDASACYLILAAARAARGDPSGAFHASERAKARVLMQMLSSGGVSIQRGMSPSERQDEERLRASLVAASRKNEAIRAFAAEQPKLPEQIKRELAEAEANYEAFRRSLYTKHPRLSIQQGNLPEVDLVELQKRVFDVEPGVAILSYLSHKDRMLIFVVSSGEKAGGPARVAVRSVEVDSRKLAEEAEEFWKACQTPGIGRPKSDELWKVLIAPVEQDLADKKHLVIVPYAPLLTLPFQALAPDAKRDTPYLVERFAVSYAPSVSALLEMRQRGDIVRARRNGPDSVVAVGGVKFSPDLQELPNSGPEAEAVAKLFDEKARLIQGGSATRKAISLAVPPARFLHFATHGIPNGLRPMFSSLAIAPDDDDGRLYGHDIINLDLSAELVVLSACDTARGKEYRGEGTMGLAWSFFVAGVPAVVVSQWSVDDEATGTLMKGFYERIRSNTATSRAENLRQAQIALIKNRPTRHPFYWAPFIYSGDWRSGKE